MTGSGPVCTFPSCAACGAPYVGHTDDPARRVTDCTHYRRPGRLDGLRAALWAALALAEVWVRR